MNSPGIHKCHVVAQNAEKAVGIVMKKFPDVTAFSIEHVLDIDFVEQIDEKGNEHLCMSYFEIP